MAILQDTGFETGDLTGWSAPAGGGGTVQSSIVNGGNYAVLISPSASQVGGYNNIGSGTLGVWRFYFYFASLPGSDVQSFWEGANNAFNVSVGIRASDHKLAIGPEDFAIGSRGIGATAVTSGVWHYVDVRANVAANPWVLDWALDGVDQGRFQPAKAADSVYGNSYGNCDIGGTFSVYFDDLAFSRTSGDYPIGPKVGVLTGDKIGISMARHGVA
jgi:hypothetical protein